MGEHIFCLGLSYEPVSDASFCSDVARSRGIIFYLLPDRSHMNTKRVVRILIGGAPNLSQHVAVGYHHSRIFGQ